MAELTSCRKENNLDFSYFFYCLKETFFKFYWIKQKRNVYKKTYLTFKIKLKYITCIYNYFVQHIKNINSWSRNFQKIIILTLYWYSGVASHAAYFQMNTDFHFIFNKKNWVVQVSYILEYQERRVKRRVTYD